MEYLNTKRYHFVKLTPNYKYSLRTTCSMIRPYLLVYLMWWCRYIATNNWLRHSLPLFTSSHSELVAEVFYVFLYFFTLLIISNRSFLCLFELNLPFSSFPQDFRLAAGSYLIHIYKGLSINSKTTVFYFKFIYHWLKASCFK